MESFFLVFTEGEPPIKLENHIKALREARKLALAKGKTVYVTKAIECIQVKLLHEQID